METALFKYICEELRADLQKEDLKKETALLQYVCSKVMTDLRSGFPPPKAVISALILQPWVGTLRATVKLEDKSLVLNLMKSDGLLKKRLGISLTKSIEQDSDISQALVTIFKESRYLDPRFEAMYRLLDNPRLDKSLLEEVYHLAAKDYYPEWKEHVLEWQGGAQNIMKQVPPKIDEKDDKGIRKYPEHKIWAYLYELSWVPDDQKKRAKEIIHTCLNFEWPTNEVATLLLEQMEKS